jgi:hypothetical protein
MKRIVSIFLAVLVLMNIMGYYGIFLGLKYTHTTQIHHRLDTDSYTESETVTIKVPLAIPYAADTEYERVDGEIEHNGQSFRLVKQKLVQDTLYIVCIRDVKSDHLKQALAEYVKTFRDAPQNGPQQKIVPSFIKDFIQSSFDMGTSSTGWRQVMIYANVEERAKSPFLSSPSPPPKS